MPSLRELRGNARPEAELRINDRSELPNALARVKAHLDGFPTDGDLFLVNPVGAMQDLKILLADSVREHVVGRFQKYKIFTPDEKNIYERSVSGELSPFILNARLRPPGSTSSKSVSPDDAEDHPLSLLAEKQAKQLWEDSVVRAGVDKSKLSPIPVSAACGYDVAFQISEEAVNQTIAEAYDHGALSKIWSGREQAKWGDFGITVAIEYSIQLTKPEISLATPKPDAVTLTIGAKANVAIEIDISDIPIDVSKPLSFREGFTLDLALTVETGLYVGPGSKPSLAAVYVDLLNFRNLVIAINQHNLPATLLENIKDVLFAVARNELHAQGRIPVTIDLEEASRAGVPIRKLETKMLPADAGHRSALCILIDMADSPLGNKDAIKHFIPAGQDFAFIISSELIYKGWNIAKGKFFPIREGDLKVHNPDFRLLDNRMYAKVEADYSMYDGCLGSWTIDAEAKIWTGLEAFRHDEIWHVRPYKVRTDIEMDDWDRFVFETILGALLALLGIGGPIVRSVISTIIFEIILGLAEKYAAQAIGGYSIGIYGRVPGTNRIAYSSTPTLPVVKPNGITSFGNLEFRRI